jgi:hypothetical protein
MHACTIINDDFGKQFICEMKRFYCSAHMSETVFEVRVIPLWHIIIFAILSIYMIFFVSAIVKGMRGWHLIFGFLSFFGSLLFLFLYSILFSKLKVYEDGISFRMYHVYFDEMSKIKLR